MWQQEVIWLLVKSKRKRTHPNQVSFLSQLLNAQCNWSQKTTLESPGKNLQQSLWTERACILPLHLAEVMANRMAILRDSRFRLASPSGSKGGRWRGTVWDNKGFVHSRWKPSSTFEKESNKGTAVFTEGSIANPAYLEGRQEFPRGIHRLAFSQMHLEVWHNVLGRSQIGIYLVVLTQHSKCLLAKWSSSMVLIAVSEAQRAPLNPAGKGWNSSPSHLGQQVPAKGELPAPRVPARRGAIISCGTNQWLQDWPVPSHYKHSGGLADGGWMGERHRAGPEAKSVSLHLSEEEGTVRQLSAGKEVAKANPDLLHHLSVESSFPWTPHEIRSSAMFWGPGKQQPWVKRRVVEPTAIVPLWACRGLGSPGCPIFWCRLPCCPCSQWHGGLVAEVKSP